MSSGAANLLAAGRRFLRDQFPATVKLSGISYDCATSGLRAGFDLGDGPGKAPRKIAFWIARAAFTAQPEPRPTTDLECTAPEALKGVYRVDDIQRDGTGTTMVLVCTETAQ